MKKIFSLLQGMLVVVMITAALFSKPTALEITGVFVALATLSYVASKMNIKGLAMTSISINEARAVLTNAIIDAYREMPVVTSFLRSFFPGSFKPTRYLTIEVQRGTEKVAVDILRGTGSNLNKKTRSTSKTIDPPLYGEESNINELDMYDVAFATLNPEIMANLAMEQAEILLAKTNKIERAYEKQCADVLQSGVITLKNGDNIVYPRKAESMVDLGAGSYWTTATVDPMAILLQGGKFIREKGKAQGGTYNVIMGGNAYNAMINNPIFQKQYVWGRIELGNILPPQRDSSGGTLHGFVTAGSYTFNVWTYPEVYQDENGDMVPYIEEHNIIILPLVTRFKTGYALVPQLPGDEATTSSAGGAYVVREYVDMKHKNHTQEVLSAGAAIPTAIDTIFTAKVVAS